MKNFRFRSLRVICFVYIVLGPSAAQAEVALWDSHERLLCQGLSSTLCEIYFAKGNCMEQKTNALWRIDFKAGAIAFINMPDVVIKIASRTHLTYRSGDENVVFLDDGRHMSFHRFLDHNSKEWKIYGVVSGTGLSDFSQSFPMSLTGPFVHLRTGLFQCFTE